eukprot:3993420-Prymnesium_polylepis.1
MLRDGDPCMREFEATARAPQPALGPHGLPSRRLSSREQQTPPPQKPAQHHSVSVASHALPAS